MKKFVNVVCTGLGFVVLGIGAVGVVLPILPTTPFLILAGLLFAKGSKRFHTWLVHTRIYQKYIASAVEQKAMTRKAKCSVLCTIGMLLAVGFILAPIWHARALIALVAIWHCYYFMFRIRTIDAIAMKRLKK